MKSNIEDRYGDTKWKTQNFSGSLNQRYSKTPSKIRPKSKNRAKTRLNRSWNGKSPGTSTRQLNSFSSIPKSQRGKSSNNSSSLYGKIKKQKLSNLRNGQKPKAKSDRKDTELDSEILIAYNYSKARSKSPKPSRKNLDQSSVNSSKVNSRANSTITETKQLEKV